MSNRAARRRAQKEAAKGRGGPRPSATTPGRTEQIQLQNPVSEHFASFVVGNALTWEAMAHDALIHHDRAAAEALEPYWGLMALIQSDFADQPALDAWQRFRRASDELPDRYVIVPDSAKGQHVVICGAGPSLAENAAEYVSKADQVWGCNSALPWLANHGHTVTHGFTVDQTPDMLVEWDSAPDVEYLLASTVHPHLTQSLRDKGRRIRWFHNFVGIQRDPVSWPDENGVQMMMSYEDWLYMTLFPGTIRAGSGLNTVTRAIDVALCMGFETITVLGADCALRTKARPPKDLIFGSPAHIAWLKENTTLHADGGHALASNSTPLTLGAEIDSGTPDDTVRPGHGRWWESKIDLLISARWLLALERRYPGRVNIVGDTYVAAIRGKNKAFLERLPAMIDSNGNPIEITFGEDI